MLPARTDLSSVTSTWDREPLTSVPRKRTGGMTELRTSWLEQSRTVQRPRRIPGKPGPGPPCDHQGRKASVPHPPPRPPLCRSPKTGRLGHGCPGGPVPAPARAGREGRGERPPAVPQPRPQAWRSPLVLRGHVRLAGDRAEDGAGDVPAQQPGLTRSRAPGDHSQERPRASWQGARGTLTSQYKRREQAPFPHGAGIPEGPDVPRYGDARQGAQVGDGHRGPSRLGSALGRGSWVCIAAPQSGVLREGAPAWPARC